METKVVDSRGRVALGAELAGKTVIIKKTSTGWTITPAIVVPEHEAWLWKNAAARESIETGLAQAKAGEFAADPVEIEDSWADDDQGAQ